MMHYMCCSSQVFVNIINFLNGSISYYTQVNVTTNLLLKQQFHFYWQ